MTTLEWHDPEDQPAPQPRERKVTHPGADHWFGIAVGLIGLIVGYALRMFVQ